LYARRAGALLPGVSFDPTIADLIARFEGMIDAD